MENQKKGRSVINWKESSSIILVTPAERKTGAEGSQRPIPTLEYLITKRSANHPILATSICFPGGTFTVADSSIHWQKLFLSNGQDLFRKQFIDPGGHLPNMYKEQQYQISDIGDTTSDNLIHKNQNHSQSIPKQVALRITAIRETFEECGILLCKPFPKYVGENSNVDLDFDLNQSQADQIPLILKDDDEIRSWQVKVRKDPHAFLALCQHFSCLPDLESLVEWSNWLSPSGLQTGTRRFDTIFYIRFSSTPLPTIIDPREVEYAQWTSASDILNSHHRMQNFLPPPQFYEMTRLRNVQQLSDLKSMASLRRRVGLESWCPYYYSTDDGFVATLPGDKLYRDSRELDEKTFMLETFPKTNNQDKNETQDQHRLEMIGFHVLKITATAPYRFGQLYPNLAPTGTLVTTIALKSSL